MSKRRVPDVAGLGDWIGHLEDRITQSLGGVLSGTLPDPEFAVGMATSAELDAEIADRAAADAGEASNRAAGDAAEASARATADALLVPQTRQVNGHALSSDVTVTKGDVGLGNADNTSDANKPVSTAQQAALDLKQDLLGFVGIAKWDVG